MAPSRAPPQRERRAHSCSPSEASLSSPATPSTTLPGPYAAVVLDLDGLLVQTEKLWSQAKATLFERHRTEYTEADHLAVFGTSDVFTAQYFARRFGVAPDQTDETDRIRAEYMAIATELFEGGVEISPGAVHLVDRLSGRVPLGLASNTRRPQVHTILAATPFADRFDVIVTGDDGTPKPAPDLYQLACSQLGVRPTDAIALEDSPTGVAAAKAAGLTCIGIPSHPDEQLAGADIVLTSLTELG